MVKLCIAAPVFYPTFSGAALRFQRYLPGFSQREIEVRILTGTPRAKDISEDEHGDWPAMSNGDSGVAVDSRDSVLEPSEHLGDVPIHRVTLPDQTGMSRTATYFRALLLLCENPSTRPDVIQLHSFERLESIYWLARIRKLGIPIIYVIQIARPATRGNFVDRLFKPAMLRRFYNSFDTIVTSSEVIRQYLLSLRIEKPVAVIPNGVDLERFKPAGAVVKVQRRIELGLGEGGPVIVSLGAISPRKGSDLLVEAFALVATQHPDARLVLVGPRHDLNNRGLAEFKKRLECLVNRVPHPERVHFMGLRETVLPFYQAADLVVLPTNREGGTPNVVLEAMACECAVVITPFEGQSSLLGRPGVDFEQTPRTAQDIARCMIDLIDRPDRSEALAKSGRDWVVQTMDQRISLDRFAGVYRGARDGTLCQQQLDWPIAKDRIG
ncbi:MAG: glycosyltransferase family 4 protein [Myxococcota bacterium]